MSKPSVRLKSALALGLLVVGACSDPLSSVPFSGVDVRALMGSRSRCVELRVRGESKVEGGKSGLRFTDGRVLVAVGNKSLGAWADVEAVGKLDDCTTDSGERAQGRLTFPKAILILELGPPRSGDGGTSDAGADDAGFDAGPVDAGQPDAGEPDAGTDAGAMDAGGTDAGGADAGPADAGSTDAGPVDAGMDAGAIDAGRIDSGVLDAGVDAGRVDSGVSDAGGVDAGRVDAGPPDAGRDEDGDLYPADVDCDDTNPNINPGAVEVCGDKEDNDCDLRVDCLDSNCVNLVCGTGAGAFCRLITGQDGGVCREEACGDMVDNDGDLAADCADVDCSALACVDTLACTSGGGSCSAGRCVEPVACQPAPAGTCFQQCRDDTSFVSVRRSPSTAGLT